MLQWSECRDPLPKNIKNQASAKKEDRVFERCQARFKRRKEKEQRVVLVIVWKRYCFK